MPFKYHPPTRKTCKICENLSLEKNIQPIIDSHSAKASSANNYPFHNWYNFVLGYSPRFPAHILDKIDDKKNIKVLDPFMGTGTTNVYCKSIGIDSFGLEANDYFIGVANTKMNWDIDIPKIKTYKEKLLNDIKATLDSIDFDLPKTYNQSQLSIFDNNTLIKTVGYKHIAKFRPVELLEKYICDRPFVKLYIIQESIESIVPKQHKKYYNFFKLALSSIIVPSSNISYGPGFGVRKPKFDVDVLGLFIKKVNRMIKDLESVSNNQAKNTPFTIKHGDARKMSEYYDESSIDIMITSPPYPGDHEYTKHTKLELIFENHARTIKEFRIIKKRMLVGSTTNIYKDNNDREFVKGNNTIEKITTLIQKRLDEDNATSGFEKLYTKLVWEYFGGMTIVFKEALKVLKSGGKFFLLVSDSHAFKMVHIRTAEILREIALTQGFTEGKIELWQNKKSTSHSYNLREEILTLIK